MTNDAVFQAIGELKAQMATALHEIYLLRESTQSLQLSRAKLLGAMVIGGTVGSLLITAIQLFFHR